MNGKLERHNQTITGMVRVGTIYHGLGDHLWCCKAEDAAQKYNAIIHSAHKDVPDFLWYGRRPSIYEFRICGCKLEARIKPICIKYMIELNLDIFLELQQLN